jgi:aminoglycoside phosphotransferase (APT) family kinase protein
VYGKYVGTTVPTMLDHIAHWLETGGDADADQRRLELLTKLGVDEDESAPALTPDFEDRSHLGASLEAAVEAQSDQVTRDLAMIEREVFAREVGEIAAAVDKDRTAMASVETAVTVERLDHYFQSHEVFRNLHTRSITRIPGGYSKDTFLVATEGERGPHELVIRRDFPFGPTETSAADEYDVLSCVAERGLPVARPLAAERDRAILGQPFLVVERIAGVNAATVFAADPAVARAGSLELARILGQLHAIDLVSTNLSGVAHADPTEAVRRHIAMWRAHWMRHRIHPVPLIQSAFSWLDRHVPKGVARSVLVHADARPDNMLVENGKVTALLDWEFTHVGDPAEDLEYTRLFVEPFVDWTSFVAEYLAAGGIRVSDASSRFYEVWRSVRNFVCCDVSWGGFTAGRYPSIKLSAQGIIWRRYFLRTTAEALERVA